MRMIMRVLVAGLTVCAAGCGDRGDRQEQTTEVAIETETEIRDHRAEMQTSAAETLEAAGDYATASKAQLQTRLQALYEDIQARMDALQQESGEQAEQLRAELTEKKRDVQQAMQDVKASSADAWDEARNKASEALIDVGNWLKHTGE